MIRMAFRVPPMTAAARDTAQLQYVDDNHHEVHVYSDFTTSNLGF